MFGVSLNELTNLRSIPEGNGKLGQGDGHSPDTGFLSDITSSVNIDLVEPDR